MAKIEKMFGAILKDQEQKSDELRDKIHAENKLKKKGYVFFSDSV